MKQRVTTSSMHWLVGYCLAVSGLGGPVLCTHFGEGITTACDRPDGEFSVCYLQLDAEQSKLSVFLGMRDGRREDGGSCWRSASVPCHGYSS